MLKIDTETTKTIVFYCLANYALPKVFETSILKNSTFQVEYSELRMFNIQF